MLVLAIASGAPLLPKKLMRLGRDRYVRMCDVPTPGR